MIPQPYGRTWEQWAAALVQYLDPHVLNLQDIKFSQGQVLRVLSVTVAPAPSATPAGRLIFVSDEAGGATMAFSDGSNWRRTSERAGSS